MMRVVPTRVYSRRVAKILTDAERQTAEDEIIDDPERWPVIPGTGGIRKARAARGSRGKSGGARIIFYYWSSEETLYFLTVYAKSDQSDLSPADKRTLSQFVESLQ